MQGVSTEEKKFTPIEVGNFNFIPDLLSRNLLKLAYNALSQDDLLFLKNKKLNEGELYDDWWSVDNPDKNISSIRNKIVESHDTRMVFIYKIAHIHQIATFGWDAFVRCWYEQKKVLEQNIETSN